jgi:hypothetical protein
MRTGSVRAIALTLLKSRRYYHRFGGREQEPSKRPRSTVCQCRVGFLFELRSILDLLQQRSCPLSF